jgi:hypothetical protein
MKGLRFRRTMKIAPGLRLNFGLRGLSLTAGRRGAGVTVGPSGTRVSAGLPGTGLSVTRKLRAGTAGAKEAAPQRMPVDTTLIARMGVSDSGVKMWIVTLSATVMCVSFAAFLRSASVNNDRAFATAGAVFLLSFIGLIIGFSIKSPYRKATIERGRRITLLQPFGDQIDRTPTREAIEDFRSRQVSLQLRDTDLGTLPQSLRVIEERIVANERAIADMAGLQERIVANGGLLPTVAGHERAVGDDACYLAVQVFYDKRGDNDETGTLYLTDKRVMFVGTSVFEAPWTKVVKAQRDGQTFSVLRRDRQNPNIFECESLSDAVQVEFVAVTCLGGP